MEENTQKFLERLKELVALGKKKKSILEIQEYRRSGADVLKRDRKSSAFECRP